MKKIGIAFLILIAMSPLVAGENISLSIPKDFQGMWLASDEYYDTQLLEISSNNIYFSGVSLFTILDDPSIQILDIETRESQRGYTITVKTNINEETDYLSIILALDNNDCLLLCFSVFSTPAYSLPYCEIFTYSKLG